MPKVTITSPDLNGHTQVGINGDVRHIKHNTTTEVSDGELEVLKGANLGTATLKVEDDGVDAEQAQSVTAAAGEFAGTEHDPIQAPATPAGTSEEENPALNGEEQEPQTADEKQEADERRAAQVDEQPEAEPKPAAKSAAKPRRKAATK